MPIAIFDLDNTLVDRTVAFNSWCRRFAADHHLDAESVVPFMEAADDGGERPRDEFFATAREELHLRTPVAQLVAAWWPAYLESYRCTPDTSEALRTLRIHGWKIGIATNGDAGQAEKIHHAGLHTLVDAWCVSDLVGYAKPDPQILRLVARECGVGLEGAWMIGDSGPTDIAGAVAAGASSAWLSRGRTWIEVGYCPTIVADSVVEAVAKIVSAS